MCHYKSIERSIGEYIATHYKQVVEVGIGNNSDTAMLIASTGTFVLCIDIKPDIHHDGLTVITDDIFEPDISLYGGADLIYALRPGVEMVPPLIDLAVQVDCDLLVYHLGSEVYRSGGDLVNCGPAILHHYHHRTPPVHRS